MKVLFRTVILCSAVSLFAQTAGGTVGKSLYPEVANDTVHHTITPSDTIKTQVFSGLKHNSDIARKSDSEISLVSAPWFLAGMLSKNEKKTFRMARHKFVYDFHNKTDDYIQYAPLALATAMKFAGVEGRSNTKRYLFNTAVSYAVMAGLVNATKYTVRELRPDGSTRNSFPSGHTATAFAAATILHKEYGLTRSPIYSIAGYTLATATGCMRVLNNRHWISDMFAGAGIGILSTELGYAIGDLLFKNKGIVRQNIEYDRDLLRNPSFFSVQIGLGMNNTTLDIPDELNLEREYEPAQNNRLTLGKSTAVGFEGAYFFNPYIGIGGRLRVNSTPVKNWPLFAKHSLTKAIEQHPAVKDIVSDYTLSIGSEHFSEFTLGAGLYLSYPLVPRLAVGAKLLLGRSYMRGIDINAHAKGRRININIVHETINNKKEPTYYLTPVKPESIDPSLFYETTWDYLTVDANRSLNCTIGTSLTFAYKSLYSFKLFADLDITRKTYKVNYAPMHFLNHAVHELTLDNVPISAADFFKPAIGETRKNILGLVLGTSFCFSF